MTDSVLDLFRKSGALLEGHFRLSSGLHSDKYLQSALVLQYPEFASILGEGIAERTRHLDPTVVLSPALGGIVRHVSSSAYFDKMSSCDERSCNAWVRNDWNVAELIGHRRAPPQ